MDEPSTATFHQFIISNLDNFTTIILKDGARTASGHSPILLHLLQAINACNKLLCSIMQYTL